MMAVRSNGWSTVTVSGPRGAGLRRLLARRGARVTLSDTRAGGARGRTPAARNVTLELGGHQTETFTSADLVVLSPGVPPGQPAVAAAREHGVPVIGESSSRRAGCRGA